MQRRFYGPLAFAVIGLIMPLATAAYAQDEGGPLLSPVELELQNAGTDDQLIKLARAAKINVMADASDWAENAKKVDAPAATLTVSKKQPLLEWLRDMAYANRLTWQRNAGNTVILWSEPDIVPLTRRVVAEAAAQWPQVEIEAKAALHDKLDPALVARLDAEPEKWSLAMGQHALFNIVLLDSLTTLAKERGWDGQNQNFRLKLGDDAIPAALRSQIILSQRILQAQPERIAARGWLDDQTWQKARLFVRKSKPSSINGKEQPIIWWLGVEAPLGPGASSQTVATLSTVDGRQQ